jgi:hypothetical protein
MLLVNFQGKTNLGFINTEFSSHIIFVSGFPYFAHSHSAFDETHIRGCEYGSFAGFDEK